MLFYFCYICENCPEWRTRSMQVVTLGRTTGSN
jgi:hypothetical protein